MHPQLIAVIVAYVCLGFVTRAGFKLFSPGQRLTWAAIWPAHALLFALNTRIVIGIFVPVGLFASFYWAHWKEPHAHVHEKLFIGAVVFLFASTALATALKVVVGTTKILNDIVEGK